MYVVDYSTNVKAAEHSTDQLKVEEERLARLRAEIMQEKAQLDKKKEDVCAGRQLCRLLV
jgi:uncharacterized small protein (DUF1192 family)